MFNKWSKLKSYLTNSLGEVGGGVPGTFGGGTGNPYVDIFIAIGKAVYKFFTQPAVQLTLFVASGVNAHIKTQELKKTGQEILLTKFGTGGAMPVIYGTRRVAGTVVYMNTAQYQKELFVVYAIAGHEIDSFNLETLQIDGRPVSDVQVYRDGFIASDGTTRITSSGGRGTKASGNFFGSTQTEIDNVLAGTNPPNRPRMVFNCHTGATTQAADPMLVGCVNSWTTDHKLSGIAYIACNFEYDIRGQFTGLPNLTVVVNGKKLYDPRADGSISGGTGSQRADDASTHTWSANPSLALLDYMTDDDYGKGLDPTETTGDIDLGSFQTAADACDVSADTITHSSVVVELANTSTDVLVIANANEADFNNFKIGSTFTVTDGVTTYINNKRLIDKDIGQITDATDTAVATLQLTFEDGAVDTAITSNTTCTFTETQVKFDCHGVIDTEESILENTKALVANMRGIFTYSNGQYSIKVEGAESSVVSLDEDDIFESGLNLSLENKEAKFNKVEAEFYNAQKRYETDTTYYTGESGDDFLTDDGDEILETRIQLPFCTNQRIAYNHAKALLKRSRSQKTVSFVATPKVLQAKVGEVITITSSNMGLSNALFRITNMVINPDLNIEVTAIEYQSDIYGYVTPPDESIGVINDPVDGQRVEAPTNLQFSGKNTSTGEPAKLTWTDSTKYPSYEFRVVVKTGNTSTIPNKTRFDRRTKETFFYLDGINIDSGFTAFVSAINTLGVESEATERAFAVTTAPVTTPDIEQGSIGGFSFTASKMYHPVDGSDTGVFETSNVYIDDSGQFSLKDKLSFDGTTLDISGNLTVENTITADKIVVDGINLDNLISATTQSGSIYLTEFTGIKIATSGSTSGYPPLLKLQDDTATDAFTDITQSQTGINIRARAGTTKGTIRFQGRDSGITPVNYGGFDSDGNWEIGTTDVIKATRDLANVQSIALDSNTPSTTTNKLYQASGTLYWNGNQVGVGAINSVTNMADNRVLTASGSNSANGEANLTFDGSTLDINGNINITEFIKHRGDNDTYLQFTDDDISLFAGGVEFISMNEAGSDTITLHQNTTASGNLIVSGDLTVNGVTTTLNTATLDVEDKNITLNYSTGNSNASANGAGITIQDAVDASTDATILWNSGNDRFDFSHTVNITGGLSLSADATFNDDVTFELAGASITVDHGNDKMRFDDNIKATFGNSDDLQIYHDSLNSYIKDNGTGNLWIQGSTQVNIGGANGTIGVQFVEGANVTLRHNNSPKLATTSTGIDVTGSVVSDGLTVAGNTTFNTGDVLFTGASANILFDQSANALEFADNAKAQFGTGNDLQIYHDGNDSYVDDAGTGILFLRGNGAVKIQKYTGEAMIDANADGSVYLYNDNAIKLQTTSSGIDVTGTISSGDITVNDQIIASGDSDTYLQFHAADQFRVVTGGAERLEVNTSETKLTAGNLNVISGQYLVNGQAVITNARALTNISSVTTSGDISLTGGGVIKAPSVTGGEGLGLEAAGTITVRIDTNGNSGDDQFFKVLKHTNDELFTVQETGNATFAGDISIPVAKSLYFGGGSHTYIREDIDDRLRFFVGGAEFMRFTEDTTDTTNFYTNATFAGTISSGAITSSGQVYADELRVTNDALFEGSIDAGNNTIASGAIESSASVTANTFMQIVGASGSSGFMYIYDRDNGTSNTDGFLLQKSGNNAFVYNRESSGSLSLGAGDTSNYLVIDSSGNIDLGSTQILDQSRNLTNIGTISSGALTVTADAGNEQLVIKRASNTNEQLIFGFHSGDYGTIQAVEQNVAFRPLVLQPSGANVGIGTTSPSELLHVYEGTSSDSAVLKLESTTNVSTDPVGEVQFFNTAAGNAEVAGYIKLNSDSGGRRYYNMEFGTGRNANADTKMIIDSLGNVLVGQTSALWNNSARGNVEINGSSSAILALNTGGARAGYIFQSGDDMSIVNTKNSFVRIFTNDTERFRIDNSGRVGIGETNPTRQLHLTNSANALAKVESTGANYAGIDFENTSRLWYAGIRVELGHGFGIKDEDANRVRLAIDTSGNVDIPQGNFEIGGTQVISSGRELQNTRINTTSGSTHSIKSTVSGSVYSDTLFLGNTTSGGHCRLGMSSNDTDGQHHRATFRAQKGSGQYEGELVLQMRAAGGGFNDDFIFKSGGTLGVGTTSPSHRLHVNSGGTNVVGVFESTDSIASIAFKDSATTSASHVNIGADANDMVIVTGGTEKARISSSGTVGIATSSPSSSYKLDVNGKIRSQQEMLINTGSLFVNQEGEGIHLLSPNGTEYKITVDNSGNLVVTEQ